MKALVTGIGGFVGSYLAEYLLEHTSAKVWGIVHSNHINPGLQAVLAHPESERVQLVHGDMTDAAFVAQMLGDVQPEYIFHLAGQASVGASWSEPEPTYLTNILGQLHLLEGMLKKNIEARVLVVGTSEEYGAIRPDELPVDEQTPLRPGNPYAVSKVTQDFMGYQYWSAHKMHIVRVRPFNHIGPRQSDAFAVGSFARQIAEIEHGLRPPVVRVGNLESKRDFTDVRDIVRGYKLALDKGEAGQVYNLGSGIARRMADVLDTMIAMSRVAITLEQDPARMRPSDVPELRCDASRFAAQTGWCPEIPFDQTLQDALDYWRAVVASQS